jgi:RHS repeat-associated protein
VFNRVACAFIYDAVFNAATINSAAYNIGGGYVNAGSGAFSYGPVSLRYTSGSTPAPTSETRYLYMGRLVVQERAGNNTPTVSYTRGRDLGSAGASPALFGTPAEQLQSAGGIGGLLARSHGYSGGTWSTHNAYHADGNGNITALINTSQSVTANYRYDPYGNLLFFSGTLAAANTYRFSSKELMLNSGIYYYGFRYYEPNFQRWLSRDPLGEQGGINLYRFNYNSPLHWIDPDGRSPEGVAIGIGAGGVIGGVVGGTIGAGIGIIVPGIGSVTLGPIGAGIGAGLGATIGGWIGSLLPSPIICNNSNPPTPTYPTPPVPANWPIHLPQVGNGEGLAQ